MMTCQRCSSDKLVCPPCYLGGRHWNSLCRRCKIALLMEGKNYSRRPRRAAKIALRAVA